MGNILVPVLTGRYSLATPQGLRVDPWSLLTPLMVPGPQARPGDIGLLVYTAQEWDGAFGPPATEPRDTPAEDEVLAAAVPSPDGRRVMVPELGGTRTQLALWEVDSDRQLEPVIDPDVDGAPEPPGPAGWLARLSQVATAARSWRWRRRPPSRCRPRSAPLGCVPNGCSGQCAEDHYIDPDLGVPLMRCACP